jgi:hypothetical protein
LSTPYESATLLIRLYELRREPKMREARTWFVTSFHAATFDEVMQVLTGPNSASFRMVASYWDMAASFVINGAIDEKMFTDSNGEHTIVYAKIEPFLAEYRARTGNPHVYASLEKLVLQTPGMKDRLAAIRERFKPRT